MVAMEANGAGSSLDLYDPKCLIRQVMELDEPRPGSARDCLVLWLMSLPDDTDPAEAARYLLEVLLYPSSPSRPSLAAELAQELEEVARFPREHLGAARSVRRSRLRRV